MKRSLTSAAALLALLAAVGTAGATPPGTAFTYQGRLMQSGQPFSGNASMRFSLYDAPTGGNLVGGIIAILNQPVSNGLFTTQLDFGAGVLPYVEQEALWLEIVANGTTLSPRQALTAAPQALHATSADDAREAANRFDITGADGSLNFATGRIGIDHTIPGFIIDNSDLFIGGNSDPVPRTIHFGTATGGPSMLIDPAGCLMLHVSEADIDDGITSHAQLLRFGDETTGPGIGMDPAVGPGLLLDHADVYIGGPGEATPRLFFGGVGDPNLSLDRGTGSIIIHLRNLTIGDGSVTQPKALRFGDPVSGPGIGTDPNVAGTIVYQHDLTIGGPAETGAKAVHFGVDPRDPMPFIGTSATNSLLLTISAPDAIRLDGSYVGVGLASTALPQFRLDLPNTAGAAGQGRANAWTTYSSRRWKENIRPIDGALDKVSRLEGVSFDWKPEQGGGHDIGFVAEDVGRVLPELVEWEPGGVWARSLKYDRMTAVAVEAVKEQQKQIVSLRSRIAEQEQLIGAQAGQLAELAARLERLEAAR